eukprot:scaffold46886_cov28-Tisochrysis_lutea.AAC.12
MDMGQADKKKFYMVSFDGTRPEHLKSHRPAKAREGSLGKNAPNVETRALCARSPLIMRTQV